MCLKTGRFGSLGDYEEQNRWWTLDTGLGEVNIDRKSGPDRAQ